MRDPNRIPRMLKLLESVWYLNPDMRLGQLIENLTHSHTEGTYHVEDDKMEADMKSFLSACQLANNLSKRFGS